MEIVRPVNQVRRENGVSALPVNQSLMDAAQDYSMGMHTSHKTDWNVKQCWPMATHMDSEVI